MKGMASCVRIRAVNAWVFLSGQPGLSDEVQHLAPVYPRECGAALSTVCFSRWPSL